MASFDMGAAGGGAAMGSGFGPWGALAGGILGGFLGGPRMPPELARLYKMQYSMADQLRRFAQSVPLSQGDERFALAQQRGQLGQQQRADQSQLIAAMNRNQGTGNLGDFMTNLNQQQVGQQMAVDSSHLFNAMANRRAALGQASNIASQAAGTYQAGAQNNDLAGTFGNLARALAYQNANKQPRDNTRGAGLGLGQQDVYQATQLKLPTIGGTPGNYQGVMDQIKQNLETSMPGGATLSLGGVPGLKVNWDWSKRAGRR